MLKTPKLVYAPHIKRKKKPNKQKPRTNQKPIKKNHTKTTQTKNIQTTATKNSNTATIKQTKIQNTKRNKNGSCFRVILTLNISIPILLPFLSTEWSFYLHRCDFLHCYEVHFKYLLPKTALWSNYCYSDH